MPFHESPVETATIPRLLGPREVAEALGVSIRSFYAIRTREDFPREIRVLPGKPRWKEGDILAYLESL